MKERRTHRTKTAVFWQVMGGRKQLNGYIFAVLCTVMVFALKGSFAEYAMWLAAALLGTSLMVAHEDKATPRVDYPARRADDVAPPTPAQVEPPHEWADGDPHAGLG